MFCINIFFCYNFLSINSWQCHFHKLYNTWEEFVLCLGFHTHRKLWDFVLYSWNCSHCYEYSEHQVYQWPGLNIITCCSLEHLFRNETQSPIGKKKQVRSGFLNFNFSSVPIAGKMQDHEKHDYVPCNQTIYQSNFDSKETEIVLLAKCGNKGELTSSVQQYLSPSKCYW